MERSEEREVKREERAVVDFFFGYLSIAENNVRT